MNNMIEQIKDFADTLRPDPGHGGHTRMALLEYIHSLVKERNDYCLVFGHSDDLISNDPYTNEYDAYMADNHRVTFNDYSFLATYDGLWTFTPEEQQQCRSTVGAMRLYAPERGNLAGLYTEIWFVAPIA